MRRSVGAPLPAGQLITLWSTTKGAQRLPSVSSASGHGDRHTGIPHFETKAATEQLLAESGVPYPIVGPTYFYDNIVGGSTT